MAAQSNTQSNVGKQEDSVSALFSERLDTERGGDPRRLDPERGMPERRASSHRRGESKREARGTPAGSTLRP